MNGFMEFLDQRVVQSILSWERNDVDCYEYFDSNRNRKTKKSANRLTDNCSDHMTGLVIAAVGLFIKTA